MFLTICEACPFIAGVSDFVFPVCIALSHMEIVENTNFIHNSEDEIRIYDVV